VLYALARDYFQCLLGLRSAFQQKAAAASSGTGSKEETPAMRENVKVSGSARKRQDVEYHTEVLCLLLMYVSVSRPS
jgi:hypothetical protein